MRADPGSDMRADSGSDMRASLLFPLALLLLLSRASLGKERQYYIAAVYIDWDYTSQDHSSGASSYKKVVYRAYDAGFKHALVHPAWLGLLGPTLRGQEGDVLVVTFRNMVDRPYSIHPHGIAYGKQSEGSLYFDNTSGFEKEDDIVGPGQEHTYYWKITSEVAPSVHDPGCLTYTYLSHYDFINDYNSGLIGALLVCKEGSLSESGEQVHFFQEFVLLFGVFDETKSWYRTTRMSPDGAVKYTINGYTNGSIPDLSVCAHSSVSWHLLGMSSEPELFSVHFNGQVLQHAGHRVSSVGLISGTATSVNVTAVHQGHWMLSSHISPHMEAGMFGYLSVQVCKEVKAPIRRLTIQQMRQSQEWTYYIAAEETIWDYAPNMPDYVDSEFRAKYLKQGPDRIGRKYKKAVFAQYTDETFTVKDENKQRKMETGILGPVIRAQIRDVVRIVFKNMASRPYSIYPHGLTIAKAAEGANYPQGGNQTHSVQPGQNYTYVWRVIEEDEPTASDSRCLTRMYHSAVDSSRDIASGLVGHLLICKSESLNKRNAQMKADKEQQAMLTVFDENKSWYIDDNIKTFCSDPARVNKEDPDFYASNVMHSINGYVYDSGQILGFCQGEIVTWHMSSVGAQDHIQTITFYGHNFELNDGNEDTLSLFPMTGETITMTMENPGIWLLASLNSLESKKGMRLKFRDVECYQSMYEYEDSTEEAVSVIRIEDIDAVKTKHNDELEIKDKKRPEKVDESTEYWGELLGLRTFKNKTEGSTNDFEWLDLANLLSDKNSTENQISSLLTPSQNSTGLDPTFNQTLQDRTGLPTVNTSPLDSFNRSSGQNITMTLEESRDPLLSDHDNPLDTYGVGTDETAALIVQSNITTEHIDITPLTTKSLTQPIAVVTPTTKPLTQPIAVVTPTTKPLTQPIATPARKNRSDPEESSYTATETADYPAVTHDLFTYTVDLPQPSFNSTAESRNNEGSLLLSKISEDISDYDNIVEVDYPINDSARHLYIVSTATAVSDGNQEMLFGNTTDNTTEHSINAETTSFSNNHTDDYNVTDSPVDFENLRFGGDTILSPGLVNISSSGSTNMSWAEGDVVDNRSASLTDVTLKPPLVHDQDIDSSSEEVSSVSTEDRKDVLIYLTNNSKEAILSSSLDHQREHWGYEGVHNMLPFETPDHMKKYTKDESAAEAATAKNKKTKRKKLKLPSNAVKIKKRVKRPESRSELSPRGHRPELVPRGSRPITREEDLSNRAIIIGVPRRDFHDYELYTTKAKDLGDTDVPDLLEDSDDDYEYLHYKDPYTQQGENQESDDTTNYFLKMAGNNARTYFIAAEEVDWDYEGYGQSRRQERINSQDRPSHFTKVIFRSYLDSTFTTPYVRGELDEHLGILGPIIKAEVDQTIMVFFKNLASRPYSLHAHGVSYTKQMEGLKYDDGSFYFYKLDNEVQPGTSYTYIWKADSKLGPKSLDSDCRTWAYYSGVNPERDINSGLIGPLLICRKGTLNKKSVDTREFVLLFMTFDETKSWYFEKNAERIQRKNMMSTFDPHFHAINGIIYSLKGLRMYSNQLVSWHLLNMGAPKDVHSVHFHGQTFLDKHTKDYRQGVYPLLPGNFATLEMWPSKPGLWLLESEVGSFLQRGMQTLFLVLDDACQHPLGLVSQSVKDRQITASQHTGEWKPHLARLHNTGRYNAWSLEQNKDDWIQVDFLRSVVVSKVATQGAKQMLTSHYVMNFSISYSTDKKKWTFYKGDGNSVRMAFTGNKDSGEVMENTFFPPLIGRFVRLYPLHSYNRPTVRMEFYGCELDGCSVPLGMQDKTIEDFRITASSSASSWLRGPWKPALARLNNQGAINAWQAQHNNMQQWLQLELKDIKKITGIITQGAKSMGTEMYVTEFIIQYSNDGKTWTKYTEDQDYEQKVFLGNTDYNSHVRNYISPPIFSRFIRIVPQRWEKSITMRIELLGCDF